MLKDDENDYSNPLYLNLKFKLKIRKFKFNEHKNTGTKCVELGQQNA